MRYQWRRHSKLEAAWPRQGYREGTEQKGCFWEPCILKRYDNQPSNLSPWQLLGRLLVRVLLPGVRDGLVLRVLLVSFLPRLSGQVWQMQRWLFLLKPMLISRSESYRIGDSNCLWFFCGTLHLCSFLNIEQHEIKDFIRCHPAPESAPTSCVASGGPGQVKSSSLLGSYQLISRISFFIMMQPVTSFVHKHDGFQFLANQLSWENYRD